jgi:ribosome biogenesis GTPase / thiamine phosphate phosphatase
VLKNTGDELETTFDQISQLANHGRFKDCSHTLEIGCAILSAIDQGQLDPSVYQHYLALLKEKKYFATSMEDRRKKERVMGKMFKKYTQNHKK